MTVVVLDKFGTLACDGRSTVGGRVISDSTQKMYRTEHPDLGPLVGCIAGSLGCIGPWLEVIPEMGFAPLTIHGHGDEGNSMQGLFLDRDGNAWIASTDGTYFHHGKDPVAIGSGSDLALYLLKKGKRAVDVVKEVCEHDLFCGGIITTYNPKTDKIRII